MTCLAVVR